MIPVIVHPMSPILVMIFRKLNEITSVYSDLFPNLEEFLKSRRHHSGGGRTLFIVATFTKLFLQ